MGKFRDDGGAALTTVVAYNAFFALFPLLLVVVTVLGFLLGRDSGFQQRLVGSGVRDRSRSAVWLYLGAQLTLYAAEVNVVAARRPWPRGLLQPPLANANQPAPVDLADQQQRRS
jgi:uncharacterized BrkB/YihY/UPF0761 family membrane protein